MGETPEREIMQSVKKEIVKKGIKKIILKKKIRGAAVLLAGTVLLSGCTRKEELLVLDEETAVEKELEIMEEETAGEEQETEADGATIQSGVPLQEESGPELIYVHVCGAVVSPGVYELQAGSRVYEAVQKAGGFTRQAERNYVNQAQTLTDGVKLTIPTAEEVAAAREAEASAAEAAEGVSQIQAGIVDGMLLEGAGGREQAQPGDGRININTASETQLCEIPGIGATRAAAIAAYREAHGGFKKPEDIMQVSGIKEGMYEKIKDSICVN